MNETDNIDLMWTLESHGWSTITLFIDDKIHRFEISHCFGDPLSELIQITINLIDKSTQEVACWYSEPGGHRWSFSRDPENQHKINIEIEEILDEVYEEIKNTETVLKFTIKESQLVQLFMTQMDKIFELLKDKQYAKDRQSDFPFDIYKKLKNNTITHKTWHLTFLLFLGNLPMLLKTDQKTSSLSQSVYLI